MTVSRHPIIRANVATGVPGLDTGLVSMKTMRAGIARLAALAYVEEDGAEGHTYRAVAQLGGA